MSNNDSLVEGDAYVFSAKGGPYLTYLKTGGTVTLDLTEATRQLSKPSGSIPAPENTPTAGKSRAARKPRLAQPHQTRTKTG